ncbi:hypothetical protein FACS1894120_6610 [Clostridia bacterium]|nr:hypothetical protein FACS1894120_6610 [Clostridia bacterium]
MSFTENVMTDFQYKSVTRMALNRGVEKIQSRVKDPKLLEELLSDFEELSEDIADEPLHKFRVKKTVRKKEK